MHGQGVMHCDIKDCSCHRFKLHLVVVVVAAAAAAAAVVVVAVAVVVAVGVFVHHLLITCTSELRSPVTKTPKDKFVASSVCQRVSQFCVAR